MRRQDPIGMVSRGKRRRVRGHDRLSNLPDCLLHGILARLRSRQAVQTSLLSRRWRLLWRDVPCADIDEREFATGEEEGHWERFEDFADRKLTSIPPETRLDAFRLNLVRGQDIRCYGSVAAAADRWIRRGLRHVPAAVHICAAQKDTIRWQPHVSCSPVSSVMGSCAAGFTRRLTTLRLVGVNIMSDFVGRLGEYCPVLEELHVERCKMYMHVLASPTLTRLAVVHPQFYGVAAPLMITAPRLASMRLDITYDYNGQGYDECAENLEPLATLAEASIRLTETGLIEHQPEGPKHQKRRLKFLKSMCSFLALLPNVVTLHLSGFPITALLDEESKEFPGLHHLKTLILEESDVGQKFDALTSILWNTPKLEKLGLHHCKFLAPGDPKSRKRRASSRSHSPTLLPWHKNLKSIEIKLRQEDAPHVVKVLSKISKGMPPAQWLKIKTSTIFI